MWVSANNCNLEWMRLAVHFSSQSVTFSKQHGRSVESCMNKGTHPNFYGIYMHCTNATATVASKRGELESFHFLAATQLKNIS